jgi:hypothetical protein
MRYEVMEDDVCIGWSELEFGDPPMGVAHGRLYPSDLYQASRHAGANANLRVRPSGSDEFLQPAAGVFVEDLSADLGPEGIEVSVLGLDAEIYERLFPHHVRAYENQFPSK